MNHNFFTDILPVLKHAYRYKVRQDFYEARIKVLTRRRLKGGMTDEDLLFVIMNAGDMYQKDIAEKLGISRAAVSLIFTGRLHKKRVEKLAQMCSLVL